MSRHGSMTSNLDASNTGSAKFNSTLTSILGVGDPQIVRAKNPAIGQSGGTTTDVQASASRLSPQMSRVG